MGERFQRFLDRLESRLALIAVLGGSSAAGIIGGWLSTYTDYISQVGPIGWFFSGLAAALMTALVALAAAYVRLTWVRASASRRWQEQVQHINPLDDEFIRRRINLSEVADPLDKTIVGKRFFRCDLLGPANIMFLGGVQVTGNTLFECDVVPIKSGAIVRNVIGLRNCSITSGRIANMTIFVPPHLVPVFRDMGAEFVSLAADDNH